MQKFQMLASLFVIVVFLAWRCYGRFFGGRGDAPARSTPTVYRVVIPVSSNVATTVKHEANDNSNLPSHFCIHSAVVSGKVLRELRLRHKIQRSELLDLTANSFEEDAIKSICSYIKNNQSLKTLVLDGNVLGVPDVRSIVQTVRRHPKLNYISFSSCNLNDEKMKPVAYLLRSNTNIIQVDISANKITHEGLETLLRAEGSLPIEFLDLSYNKIGNEGVAIISRLLKTNKFPNLVRLELKQVGADVSAFTELFSSIPASSALRYIDISGNHLFGKAEHRAAESYYSSGAQAAKHLQGLFPAAMTDALASAVDAVNSQWLYNGGEKDGDALVQTRKKSGKRKPLLPGTGRRNSGISRTAARQHKANLRTSRTRRYRTTSTSNKSNRTQTAARKSPHRAIISAIAKFATTNQPRTADSSSGKQTINEWGEYGNVSEDVDNTAEVYVGLAKTGLDKLFVQELQRTCRLMGKQTPHTTANQTELHPESASEIIVEKGRHRPLFSLGCELNGLSKSPLDMIASAVLTLHA